MVSKTEKAQISKRRAAIEAHLTEHILGITVKPSAVESVYRVEPTDPVRAEAFDQSQGDPVLYAILVSIEEAREERLAANQSGDPDRIHESVVQLDDLKDLEQHYRDPLGYPYEGLDEDG